MSVLSRYQILPSALILLTASAAWAVPSTPDFIKNAAIGGMFEVQSSQLAAQKSTNPAVQQFAQKMIADHTSLNSELKSTVEADPGLPPPPTALDAKHQKMYDKLVKKSGTDFDKTYVKEQLAAHKEAVGLFQSYADKGDNPPLKNLAGTALPELEGDEQAIKQVKASM